MKILCTALALSLMAPLLAQAADGGSAAWNTNEDGVVLDGYDVVAYFTEDRAVRGQANLVAEHEGGKFYFSSEENLNTFRNEPGKYVPRFGGFCAFGVAANKAKVPVDPKTFKIYNGELLVFFNDLYQGKKVNTKILWNQNEKELFATATKTWPTLE